MLEDAGQSKEKTDDIKSIIKQAEHCRG